MNWKNTTLTLLGTMSLATGALAQNSETREAKLKVRDCKYAFTFDATQTSADVDLDDMLKDLFVDIEIEEVAGRSAHPKKAIWCESTKTVSNGSLHGYRQTIISHRRYICPSEAVFGFETPNTYQEQTLKFNAEATSLIVLFGVPCVYSAERRNLPKFLQEKGVIGMKANCTIDEDLFVTDTKPEWPLYVQCPTPSTHRPAPRTGSSSSVGFGQWQGH